MYYCAILVVFHRFRGSSASSAPRENQMSTYRSQKNSISAVRFSKKKNVIKVPVKRIDVLLSLYTVEALYHHYSVPCSRQRPTNARLLESVPTTWKSNLQLCTKPQRKKSSSKMYLHELRSALMDITDLAFTTCPRQLLYIHATLMRFKELSTSYVSCTWEQTWLEK